ncbi:MAG: virulence factor BrkB family protein [SAR324 cluster bacterium]|nr:virulence factor BrkB family protein [SAR324 cluster bacterium]
MDLFSNWTTSKKIIHGYLVYLLGRFHEDRILYYSGYLSYVTLLSMVPLLAVVFSFFSIFPVFEKLKEEVEEFVFRNFVPALGDVVQEQILSFVENATRMTPLGLLVLLIVAVLLLSSIDHTLNQIWHVRKNRGLIVSYSIYLVVLITSPFLLGTSLAATSYLVSLSGIEEGSALFLIKLLLSSLPFLGSFLFFLLLYIIVPHTKVHFWSAVSGALIATLLFEISKSAFALYFIHFPVYQVIYGALAVIPLLFIWVFISWVVVLVGAQIAASLDGFLEEQKKILKKAYPLQ